MFNTKKRHFAKKLRDIQNAIYDWEFKRFKTLQIREEVRRDYDSLRSKLEILKTQINAEKDKPTLPTDEFKRLEDGETVLNRDIEKLRKQMEGLDIEVNGSKPTAELPDGFQGINQQLEAFRELSVLIRKFTKTI